MLGKIDVGSAAVILVTFVLFAAALFLKGFGQALLLEAGIFLVSLKLIIMSHKSAKAEQVLQRQLAALQASIERLSSSVANATDLARREG